MNHEQSRIYALTLLAALALGLGLSVGGPVGTVTMKLSFETASGTIRASLSGVHHTMKI